MSTLLRFAAVCLIATAVLLFATSAVLASCADFGCHAFHLPCCPLDAMMANCDHTGPCTAGVPVAACLAPAACNCTLISTGCKCCS